jgi:hypothetical protein
MLTDVPVIHQEQEAIAALVTYLRGIGCVLVSRPVRRRLTHGTTPFLILECRIRDWTQTERQALVEDPDKTNPTIHRPTTRTPA